MLRERMTELRSQCSRGEPQRHSLEREIPWIGSSPVAARLDARILRRRFLYDKNSVLPTQSPRAKARSYEIAREGKNPRTRATEVFRRSAFVRTRALHAAGNNALVLTNAFTSDGRP